MLLPHRRKNRDGLSFVPEQVIEPPHSEWVWPARLMSSSRRRQCFESAAHASRRKARLNNSTLSSVVASVTALQAPHRSRR
jgi:hypothetical protein